MNIRSCEDLSKTFLKKYPKFKWKFKNKIGALTENILSFWSDLGEEYEFTVYKKGKDNHEYLLDLCWSFESGDRPDIWMELGLESELSNNSLEGIKQDFWKLVDVKSYTKVGIFSPKLGDKDEVIELLTQIVTFSGIKIPVEKYLIIFIIDHGVKENPKKRTEICTYQINYLGELKHLKTRRFPG